MARPEQEHETHLLLQADDPPVICSSTQQNVTEASGSRSSSRRGRGRGRGRDSRSPGRRTRGHSRNIELDRHVNIYGRIKIEIDENIGKPVCANATRFSKAIGTIARSIIPLRCKDWKEVSNEVRDHAVDRLLELFDFDVTKKHVKKYVLRQFQNTFKEYRAELYRYYCEFESPEEALACPPERLTEPEDWKILCDRWATPEWQKSTETNKKSRASVPYLHRTGSKSFAQVQSEMKEKEGHDVDQVELFHQSHFSIKDGWVNDNARDAYLEMQKLIETSSQEGSTPMTGAEVCKQVLGHRSGHIKGLGWDPKPSSSSSITSSTQYEKELEKKVEQMKGDMVQMKANYEEMKEANVALSTQVSTWEDKWAEIHRMLSRGQREDGPSNT